MTGLVQQGGDILHHTRGVHEDERSPAEVEGVAVPTRRLPFPTVEVEESFGHHRIKLSRQGRIHAPEDPGGRGGEIPAVGEGLEGLVPPRVDGEVPWAQHLEAQPLPSQGQHPLDRGDHRLLHGGVKEFAISGSVVEAALGREGIVTIVRKSCLARRALAECVHRVKEAR